jgi:hypothetical protein
MNRKKDFPTMFHYCFRSTPAAFATAAAVAAVLLGGAAERAVAATIHVPGEFATIQGAINAASTGDEIVVADGTYTGLGNWNLNLGGKEILLRSAGGPDNCFIDVQGGPGNERRAFVFTSGETAATVIDGFTIRNGYSNRGAGVLIENGSNPLFHNCIFEDNTAWATEPGDGGAGVYVHNASPTFVDCQFLNNHVEAIGFGTGGGGARNEGGDATYINCLFEDNTVTGPQFNSGGGGALNASDAAPTFTNCTFNDNHTSRTGGGMLNVFIGDGLVTIADCSFTNNSANVGGGLRELAGRSTVTGTLFSYNSAIGSVGEDFGADGGGYNGQVGTISTFISCQFIENDAEDCCGGVGMNASTITFNDCSFIDNTARTFGGGALMNGGAEANFTSCAFEGNWAASGGGLWNGNGSKTTVTGTSFIGNTAWGELEGHGGGAAHNLDSTAAFTNCQFIGNHVEANFEFSGGGAINSADGATTIVGCLFEKNSVKGPVINSGGGGILNGGSDLHLSKSIFRNNSVSRSGGGLLNVWPVSQTATVEDCEFIENVAAFTGGGMRDVGSRSTVTNTLFKHNVAEGGAAGYIGSQGSESTLIGCRFIENHAPASSCGGACAYFSSNVTFVDCEFSGNTAAFAGGGALVDTQSIGTFTNCLFADNHTNTSGGGLWVNGNSQANIVNSTFVNNTAVSQGGGLRLISGGSAVVRNSILWSNSPTQIAVAGSAGPLSVAFSNVQGGWTGVGNINADPQFINASKGNFRLNAASPSIDSGSNVAVPLGVMTDLDGNPRFVDGDCDGSATVDMGAYEFQGKTGDLNCDGVVDGADLLILLSDWGECPDCDDCPADLDNNCVVDGADLLILLSNWG